MSNYSEPKYEFPTFKEHVKSRAMWKGSSEVADQVCFVRAKRGDQRVFTRQHLAFSDSILKCFDEILVNAIDQYVRAVGYPEEVGGPVTWIKARLDPRTGEITVSNNGQGISCITCPELGTVDGREIYVAEGLITREYGSSNFNDKEDPDRVTGGLNGLGIKLINIDSLRFEIETVDFIRKKYYHQICEDHMDVIHPPTVLDLSDPRLATAQREPHTTIKFIPDYAKLCQSSAGVNDPDWFGPANAEVLRQIFELRMFQTAAFTASIGYRYRGNTRVEYTQKPRIYFNGEEIRVGSVGDLMQQFGVEKFTKIDLEMTPKEYGQAKRDGRDPIRFPWSLCVGADPARKGTYMSIINGVHIDQGGSHCEFILAQICAGLRDRLNKLSAHFGGAKITKATLRNLLFVIDARQIPLPQFSGQTKNSIKMNNSVTALMKKIYKIPDKALTKIWLDIRGAIEEIFVTHIDKESKKKTPKVRIRKYTKADRLGTPKSMLFIPEGDSAEMPVRSILHAKGAALDYRYCGTYNIQGVPMNVQKKIKKYQINGREIIYQLPDLVKNIGLQGLAQVIGLNYSERYYIGPPLSEPNVNELTEAQIEELEAQIIRGNEAFAKLNYQSIVIATDQDKDGIGHICSLIIVYIMTFWPELIKRGFVKRLATPLMRVYCGRDVYKFYSEDEYDRWLANRGGVLPRGAEVKYYKGLGTHGEEEMIDDIGANMLENIYTFTWDDACLCTMGLHYGPGTQGRKAILTTPVVHKYDENLMQLQRIPVSTHFNIESKSFQLYFMARTLPSAIDGLIPSRRKALAGARKIFRSGNKAQKVYQITGTITNLMKYAHGSDSMNETIIKSAQIFTGSNNIPLFIPVSFGYGDRKLGRGETANARYLDIKYNAQATDLIFPREDDCFLNYELEEGAQCEPTYYVPIIPYSITESCTRASVAWKVGIWARRLDVVIANVRRMIRGQPPTDMLGQVAVPPGMTVVIGKCPTGAVVSEICKGTYRLDEENGEVRVTQLPLKVWSHPYRCRLLGLYPNNEASQDSEGNPLPRKELVEDCIDHTANDRNNITIVLADGALDQIRKNYGNEFIDPIEDYLELTQQMMPHINMFDDRGCIREFANYEEVMTCWFPIRRRLYELRIERRLILLRLLIKYYENELRFIYMDASKEINIDRNFDEAQRVETLESHGFAKFNKTRLLSPDLTPNDKLESAILGDGASYGYIDAITIGMKSKKSVAALEERLIKLRAELDELGKLTWQILWERDLVELEAVVAEGVRTKWMFGDKVKHRFKRAPAGGK
jgi:DNA topoisomerase II